jgi:hypothetical protein
MTIRRSPHDKENPYVVINKNCLQDHSISWEARGLLSYLLSLPNDWEVHVSHLSKLYKKKGGGRDAILSMLNELIECGYCERVQTKKDNGEFSKLEYHITEFKKSLTQPAEPVAVEADPVDPSHTKYIPLPCNDKPPPREPFVENESLQKNGGGFEKSFSSLIYKNTKGEAKQILESEIYSHFLTLPYETIEIQQAISEVKQSNEFIGNIFKYLEAICLRIHNSQSKVKTAKHKRECNVPMSNAPTMKFGEYMKNKKHEKDNKNEAN